MQPFPESTIALEMPKANLKPQAHSQVWRIINIVLAVFFLLAAKVNLNDDDWYFWVPMYMVPALLCVTASVVPTLTENPVWQMLTTLDFLVCLLYGLYQLYTLFLALSSALENPLSHEEGREMVGLLIILAWAGISRFSPISRSKGNFSNQSLLTAMIWIGATLAIIPLFTWSLCFIGDWHKTLGHCNNMFKS